jgi:hypothetical protein
MHHKSYYQESHYRERGKICGEVRPSDTGINDLVSSPSCAKIMHHVPCSQHANKGPDRLS